MKVGEAVRGKYSGRVGIVLNVSYSKLYGWSHILILWSDGNRALVPEHHVLGLSCE